MISNDVSPPDRFWALVEAACLGTFSQEDYRELQAILRGNSAAEQLYLEYCRMHSELRFLCGMQRANDAVRPSVASPALPPVVGILNSALHGTVGCFSSGWPLAYLLATVIFGIGLLIGSVVHVSEPVQVARQSSVPTRVDAEPKTELVGRITGMVDCKWAKGSGFRVQGSEPVVSGQWSVASGQRQSESRFSTTSH